MSAVGGICDRRLSRWAESALRLGGASGPTGKSVDQRVKFPAWMELFERRGGHLEIAQAGIADLERYCDAHDLVIIAAGRGETSKPVPPGSRAVAVREATEVDCDCRSAPAWRLVLAGTGLASVSSRVAGENIVLPTLTPSGPGHLIVFQLFPGGPWDCWQEADSVEKHLALSKRLLKDFLPRMYERCRHAEPMDATAFLLGGVAPVVREPVGQLPSGRLVLGIGDALVVNDPLTAPGANSAAKAADAYLSAIRATATPRTTARSWSRRSTTSGTRPCDSCTEWNNLLLDMPDHVIRMLLAGNEVPAIRGRFVNGFDNPSIYFDWLMSPDKAAAFLEQVALAA